MQFVISSGQTSTLAASSGETLLVSAGGALLRTQIGDGGSAVILAGGVASDTLLTGTQFSGGTQIISSGGIAVGTTLNSGGEFVYSGGTADLALVNFGSEVVSFGGVASGTVVFGPGSGVIASGGSALAVSAISGGTLFVDAGGVASGVDDLDGTTSVFGTAIGVALTTELESLIAQAVVGSGGRLEDVALNPLTTATILAGGTASGGTVSVGALMADLGLATGVTVQSGGFLVAVSGGVASAALVQALGVVGASGGGSAVADKIGSGGELLLSSGGIAFSAIISGGGFGLVSAGGVASRTEVANGGTLVVLAGGVQTGTTLAAGGVVITANVLATQSAASAGVAGMEPSLVFAGSGRVSGLDLGGAAITLLAGGTIVSAAVGGGVTISSGGVASDTVANGGLASITLSAGGVAYGTTLDVFAEEAVESGGAATGTVAQQGTLGVSFGGSAVATTIEAYGEVFDEGTAIGDLVGAKAQEVVVGDFAPAVASSSLITSGGSEFVSSAGSAFASTIEGGGLVVVSSGGLASGMRLAAGAFAIVSSGGLASGTVIASGAELVVFAGGAASGSTVEAGGTVVLDPNVLLTSNQLVVSAASGTVSGLLVGSGELATVRSGGSAVSASVVSGGQLTVSSGGLAVAAQVSARGLQVISSGGVAQGTVISSGGSQSVVGSGDAVSTVVLSSGLAEVQDGGSATGVQVAAGGEAGVTEGGFTFAASVAAGGTLANAGGVLSGAVISSWGTLIGEGGTDITLDPFASALLDGPANGLTIASGAQVQAGALLSGPVIDDGILAFSPPLEAFSGTLSGSGSLRVSGTLVLGGADAFTGGVTLTQDTVLELTSGAAAGTGGLTLTGGNLLRIAGTTMPAAPIAGLDAADAIDLTGLAFAGGGSAGIVGSSLVVSVGGATETLALAGIPSLPAGGITLFGDGAGGTLVTLGARPLAAGLAVLSVGSGSAVSNLLLLSGGSLDVLAGATATAVALHSDTSATVAGVELGAVMGGGVVTVLAGGRDSGAVISGGTLSVRSGGVVAGDTVLGAGDIGIAGGASASDVTLGGEFDNNGTLIGATVINGGRLFNGGVTSNVFVGSGGEDNNGDGTQYSPVVSSGGTLIDSGGVISGATIENGGTFELDSGGQMFGIQDDGGTVDLNDVALDGTIAGSGVLATAPGESDSHETIDPGASFAGTVEVSADTSLILAGAVPGITGPIVLDQFSDLLISGSAMPDNVISGFGQDNLIDLLSLPFASGGTATITGGNTLSIVEGGVSADLTLDPSRGYAGLTPLLATDGTSGTAITLGQTLDMPSLSGSIVTVSAGTVLSDTMVYEYATRPTTPLTVAAGGTLVDGVIQTGSVEVFGVAIGARIGGNSLTSLRVENGGTAIDLTVEGNDGGSALTSADVDGGGVAVAPTIDGGTLDLSSGASLAGTAVTFTSAGGTLAGSAAALQGVTIDGFGAHATIELLGLASTLDASVTLAGADNTLDISLLGQTTAIVLGSQVSPRDAFHISLGETTDPVTLLSVARATFVTMTAPPCFAAGTHIATPEGERRVEELRAGDLVLTAAGRRRPILWLGHRRVDCRRHPKPRDVWPVHVRAGAFRKRMPCRDLWLSPDHAVFVGGVLIPVRCLINGRTIAQQERDAVTYWHVELARHDVILADGLPCESYLDTGNRGAFADGGVAVQLHPEFALRIWDTEAFAPLVLGGPRLVAAKRRVLARATSFGHATTDDPRLRVLVDGREVTAKVTDRRQWRICLPEAAERVRLMSRVWVPAQMRPDADDTRPLGVAVSSMWLDRREVSLESSGLSSGWHVPEPDWRWTAGDSELTLTGARELAFEVAMTGIYWRSDDCQEACAG